MTMSKMLIAFSVAAGLVAAPAFANSLVAPGPRAKIADSTFSAAPSSEWNKLSGREGKNVEVWTVDGPALNKVTFFGGIDIGKPLLKETDKKNQPLPKVTPNMLITDIPALLETTYRSQFKANQISIDSQEPAIVGGHKGVKFTYSYARQDDEVQRKGEAIGTVKGNKLYLLTYEAPALHFFDKDVEKFRQLASTLKM